MNIIKKIRGSEKGQSLVEFALILPIFLLLFVGVVDYGRISTVETQVTNATQEAAKEFVHFADTPRYIQWYIEDFNKENTSKRINNELKEVVDVNVNTVPIENISIDAQRSLDNEGNLSDKVTVNVTVKVPSLSELIFKNIEIEREVTLRIPSTN